MSMIGCFYSLADADLEAVIAHPERMGALFEVKNATDETPAKSPSFLARPFGAKNPEPKPAEWRPQSKPESFDLDKAWHGIHFLLTGTTWEGNGPGAFIMHGGTEIDYDTGYGPPRCFTSAEVKKIDQTLKAIDADALYTKADPAVFAKNEIYPDIWFRESKEECVGYVISYFKDMREFISKTADANRALIFYVG